MYGKPCPKAKFSEQEEFLAKKVERHQEGRELYLELKVSMEFEMQYAVAREKSLEYEFFVRDRLGKKKEE